MLSPTLHQAINLTLTAHFGEVVETKLVSFLSGGDINQAARLSAPQGDFFVKWNSASRFPGMFEAEAKGLAVLAAANAIKIPLVIEHGIAADEAFLILEYLDTETEVSDYWEVFGAAIAKLHQTTHDSFGLDHDNYIGSLPQSNKRHDDWVSFFVEQRLEAQIRMARDDGQMGASTVKCFEKLYRRLGEIFPVEPPALLHGDLWSGNFQTGPDGKACIYDPAVYFGHREMDIAMTQLFGGYNKTFYDTYNQISPLADDWKSRRDVCNLYPLLVHLNLFGGSYLHSINKIVNKF